MRLMMMTRIAWELERCLASHLGTGDQRVCTSDSEEETIICRWGIYDLRMVEDYARSWRNGGSVVVALEETCLRGRDAQR